MHLAQGYGKIKAFTWVGAASEEIGKDGSADDSYDILE
jgi:hypothetical protein